MQVLKNGMGKTVDWTYVETLERESILINDRGR